MTAYMMQNVNTEQIQCKDSVDTVHVQYCIVLYFRLLVEQLLSERNKLT